MNAASQNQALVCDITNFGAIADTNYTSTNAIQAAIDSCYRSGGGTVSIPTGQFKTGTIILKDSVHLFLDSGSVLYASRNINDYRIPLENAIRPILIYANGAKKISISGAGKIHGNAKRTYEDLREIDAFIAQETEIARESGVEMKRFYIVKPDVGLFTLSNCTNVVVEDISLIESSFWALHVVRSQNIAIRRVIIYSDSDKGVNSDGIDINSCRDVVISNCNVTTGDDAIVLKTWFKEPCENIVVKNCDVSSSSTALKIGTESNGDFRNILFDSCEIRNSNRGLSIVVRNTGVVDGVTFSNISMICERRHFNWWGNADPIWLNLSQRNTKKEPGAIKNILFKNIEATAMGTSKIESIVQGGISNVKVQGLSIKMYPENQPDKRAEHALIIHNVDSIELSDVSIEWSKTEIEPKWGSAIFVSNTQHVSISGFHGREGGTVTNKPCIDLLNSTNINIKQCDFGDRRSELVRVSGARSHDILFRYLDHISDDEQPMIVNENVENIQTIRLVDE